MIYNYILYIKIGKTNGFTYLSSYAFLGTNYYNLFVQNTKLTYGIVNKNKGILSHRLPLELFDNDQECLLLKILINMKPGKLHS